MAIKQLASTEDSVPIKNAKMVQHKCFQFFHFHKNMLTSKSTEISQNPDRSLFN